MDQETILRYIDDYLRNGSPEEALERLDDLLAELDVVREGLKCDVRRADDD